MKKNSDVICRCLRQNPVQNGSRTKLDSWLFFDSPHHGQGWHRDLQVAPLLLFLKYCTPNPCLSKFYRLFPELMRKMHETPLCNTRITLLLGYCGFVRKAFSNNITAHIKMYYDIMSKRYNKHFTIEVNWSCRRMSTG